MFKLSFIIFMLVAIANVLSSDAPAPDCTSPLETGPCRGRKVAFGYDTDLEGCKQFIYGGCDGNGNRYNTLEECQAACENDCNK
ncbi:trypsin inhibitor-like isoform X2 [Ostrinia furnacalis]|uniref:trypsin inhibitor-like isoform X2 n=1 Tax=Ostrinia furnacalis TaxID=93504 RepID=UPI00103A8658|nr:trypsin inhibitor-like isoform X2 [Ostrinia furnacalis]